MSKAKQAKKNFELSSKLADYLVENPDILKEHPNSSYVLFSKDDKELNSENKKLIPDLLKEGKRVVRANETDNKRVPWSFKLAV